VSSNNTIIANIYIGKYCIIKVGKCQYKSANSAATCSGYKSVPSGDESALQKVVATVGPVSIAIDASSLQVKSTLFYSFDYNLCNY